MKNRQYSAMGLGFSPTKGVNWRQGSGRGFQGQGNEWTCFSGNIILASKWRMHSSPEKRVQVQQQPPDWAPCHHVGHTKTRVTAGCAEQTSL